MTIEIKDVSFGYKKENNILNNVNYTFNGGKSYVIQGRNGAGKTTLTMLLTGLLPYKNGSITLDGVEVNKLRTALIADKIGYLFQNTDMQLFANTVWEELAFPYILNETLTEERKNDIEKTLEQFGLGEYKNSFPMTLSGGEKQRLALATVFIRNVDFLILDEPSTSVDIEGKKFLVGVINKFVEEGGGVIIITHDNGLIKDIREPICLTLTEGKLYEA